MFSFRGSIQAEDGLERIVPSSLDRAVLFQVKPVIHPELSRFVSEPLCV
jgi:hypothetical protein